MENTGKEGESLGKEAFKGIFKISAAPMMDWTDNFQIQYGINTLRVLKKPLSHFCPNISAAIGPQLLQFHEVWLSRL